MLLVSIPHPKRTRTTKHCHHAKAQCTGMSAFIGDILVQSLHGNTPWPAQQKHSGPNRDRGLKVRAALLTEVTHDNRHRKFVTWASTLRESFQHR